MAFSFQRHDRDDFDQNQAILDLDLELLPLKIASIEDQLRVFVNGSEYVFDDGSDPNLLTNKWEFLPEVSTSGASAVQLRITMFNEIDGGKFKISELYIVDPNDIAINQVDTRWVGPSIPAQLHDLSGATNITMDGNVDDTLFNTLTFPSREAVKSVFFGKPGISLGTEIGTRLKVELNIGTLVTPNFVTILDEDTPASRIEFPISRLDPPTPIPWIATARDMKVATYTGPSTLLPNRIKITPPLTATSDHVILLRETRQDQPWVGLTPGAPARAATMDAYWRQLLFIAQELCEYKDVGPQINLGPASDTNRNFVQGDQQQLHLNHANAILFSYSTVELLIGVPGAPTNPSEQLIVEIGDKSDGTSTAWTTVNEEDTPADEFDFDIQASDETITLGAATTRDIRIRRVTKIDDLWMILTDPTSWSTAQVALNQRQIRFLFEEACLFPQVYEESFLASGIFPRAWNWLTYLGDSSQFYFGGPFWGGDGVVVVFVNDVLRAEGIDYTVNQLNFSIDFTGLTVTGDDIVDISSSGGGFDGGGISGGDSGPSEGEASNSSTPTPTAVVAPIKFPPKIPTARGVSVSIGSVAKAVMLTPGALEGGGTLASFALLGAGWNNHAIRIQTTVNISGIVPDGAGGFLPIGATAVAYAHGSCFTESNPLPQLYWMYHAQDLDGDGTFTSVVTSVTGCLDPDGTGGGEAVIMWNRWKASGFSIGSGDDINLRLFDGLITMAARGVSAPADVLFFNQWADLAQRSQEADDAGVVVESGFTDSQWKDHVDPFTTFSDFDIP